MPQDQTQRSQESAPDRAYVQTPAQRQAPLSEFDKGNQVWFTKNGIPYPMVVSETQLNGTKWEYKLKDSNGKEYGSGTWVQEGDLQLRSGNGSRE
ncbi:MAG: hypothetical protein M1820_008119 [Bogoriella megaspora]|nr:MAG: hypothetical protein M1820_008119 [Bogoriella megaspora]